MKDYLIIGGGIGGLADELACSRAGSQVELFERSPAFTEVGAGIQLSTYVVKLLHGWGFEEALAEEAAYPAHLQVRCAT